MITACDHGNRRFSSCLRAFARGIERLEATSLESSALSPDRLNCDYNTNIMVLERIPPPPPTQALTTNTFTPPPHDLSLTVPEIIDFHRLHSPTHVAYVYEDSPGKCNQITFATWICAIHRAGRYICDLFRLPGPQACSAKPVIALLANSGGGYPTGSP